MPRPITEAQRAAYQRNAQKSTGPRTPSGKANSRLNAVTHGLTAKIPVLSFESAADFEALRDGFLQDFAPQTTYQRYLVTQLATHAWRTLRSQQVEIGLQEVLLKKVIHDLQAQGLPTQSALAENPYAGLALTLAPHPGDPHNHLLRNYFRYSREIQTNFHRTRQALAQAPKIEPAPVETTLESTTPGFVSSPPKPEGEKTESPKAASTQRPATLLERHNQRQVRSEAIDLTSVITR